MIERNVNGIVDFCLEKVEEIDARDDIDIEKKTRMILGFLGKTRDFTVANLQFKKLTIVSPDIAKNEAIVLPIGGPKAPPALLGAEA